MKLKTASTVWHGFFCACCVVLGIAPIGAEALAQPQTTDAAMTDRNGPASSLPDRDALKHFVDSVVKAEMEEHRIAGAVVAIVSPEDVLLLQGYGFADAETRETVVASRHLFRVASVTKLFTATAIMQLVEDGRVDLDANVRTYLGGLPFDDRLGAITVAHLLAHTAGFEDRLFGYFGANAKLEDRPRREQFAALAPRQVRAPGVLTAYSNYGFVLLGEIVSRVSGKPYAQYLEDEVFAPLRMTRSTTSIRSVPVGKGGPKVEALRMAEARSHAWRNGWYAVQSFPDTLDLIEPEGSLSTTAEDMTRFMRAHLNDGALDGAAILEPRTLQQMHRPLFSHLPGVNGNAHGFWIRTIGGYTALEHDGSINRFRSSLTLIPDLGLGVFVSTNTESGGTLGGLAKRIVEHFLPNTSSDPPSDEPGTQNPLSDLTGHYIGARRVQSRLGKLANVTRVVSIAPGTKGDLIVSRRSGADRYVPIGDNRFQALRHGEIIGFGLTDDGMARYVFFGGSGHAGFERLTFANWPSTLYLPALIATLVAASVLIGYGYRLAGFVPKLPSGIDRVERLLVLTAAIACLLLNAYILFLVLQIAQDSDLIYAEFPTPGFVVLKGLGYAFVGLVIAIAVLAPRALLSTRRSLMGKARYAAFALVMLVFAGALFHWRMFAF